MSASSLHRESTDSLIYTYILSTFFSYTWLWIYCVYTSHSSHSYNHTFVTCTQYSISVDDVTDFLKAQKMDMYINTFRENGIDGDILTAITARKDKVVVEGKGEVAVADVILQDELGVKSGLHRMKLKGNIRGFRDSLTSVRSSVLTSKHKN